MPHGSGGKNGDALSPEHTPEMFTYYIRILLPNGEFLSESVTCSAKKPPNLLEVLESNCEKFSKIHPTPTGHIYGYIKFSDQQWDECVDLEPTFYPRTPVRPNDKIELWYSLLKQHPNAVLLPMKDEQDPAPVVQEFHLQIFEDNNFMVENDVPLKPGVQQSITELIKHIGAHCNVVTGSRRPREMFGWIMKNEGQNNYVEVDVDDKFEGGAAYQLHFVEFDYMIKEDLKAYFILSNSDHGELQLVRVEKHSHGQKCQYQDVFCDTRAENPKCQHEGIPKEVSPVKSCVYLRVFRYSGAVAEDIFSFEQNVPQTFHKVISYLDEKHNLVVKDGRFVIHTFAWILKVAGENEYTEVDLNGVVEEGMNYHVRFVFTQFLIEDDVSAYLKIKCSAPGNKKLEFELIQRESAKKKATDTILDRIRGADEDPELKREESSKVESVVPAESCIFLRVYKDQRVVVEQAVPFDPNTPPTFQHIVEQIDAHHNVFAESALYRQIIYACIFKVGSERKLEVDLNGVVEDGVIYHVYFVQSQHGIEDGVSAIFKISYGGHENKKHEFEVIKRGSAFERLMMINDRVSERCEQFSKKEDPAALPAKCEIHVQLFSNGKYSRYGSMSITPSDCLSFKILISVLNRKWKIFTLYGRYALVWILKDMGENQYEEVDLNGVAEEGATYQVHFSTFITDLVKDLSVTAYFKISYLVNEKLDFEYLVRANLRAKRYAEAVSGRRVSLEEHVPSKKYKEISCRNIPQPSHVQPEDDVLTETRRLILNMVPISAAASKKIRMNKSSLEDQIEQLRCSRYQTRSLQEHLYMKVYAIETTPLEKPRTVCASERCVEKVPIGDGKSGRFNVLYKQICHDPCFLTAVTPGKYPDTAMLGCGAFECGSRDKCIECGCNWEFHLHIKHLQEIVEEKAVNRELQKMLAAKDNQHLSIADVIRSYEVQLAQLKDDEELIKKMSAKFSTFLRNNSMSIRNDVYADYLKHTLKMAEQELAVGGCYKKVAELRQSLQAYEQEIEFLLKAENSSGPVTIEDIFELKKELRALAERHGEIGDMLNIAEEETMIIEAKKPESSAEDSSKKSKKKSKGGAKTYNKSMLKDFM